MPNTRQLKKQRSQMWKGNPRCHWCGVKTIPPEWFKTMPPDVQRKLRGRMATIDHLRPRHHPGRLEPCEGREFRRVLSCHKCNNERDRTELEQKPREYFYQNGGGRPLSMRPLDELKQIESILLSKQQRVNRRADREKVNRSLIAVREAIQTASM